MNLNFKSPYFILIIEALIIFLMIFGVLPRWFSWILTAGLTLYIAFASLENSLVLFVASIPLFIALPVTETFDSMSNWRILLSVLFLKTLFKHKSLFFEKLEKVKNLWKSGGIVAIFNYCRIESLAAIFLILAVLSLFAAADFVAGLKKILFLLNIFLLFIVVKTVALNKNSILKIVKTFFATGLAVILIGYSQFISIFFISLYDFWQWWAKNVISVFYGAVLSKLLAVSNTWFSFYADKLPTLRPFSTFPDSHSFTLFTLLSIPSVLTLSWLFFSANRNKRFLFYFILSLFLLIIIFTGSRGVWLTIFLPLSISIYLILKNIFYKNIIKTIFLSFILFFLLWPVASVILNLSQENSRIEINSEMKSNLVIQRAKTIFDTTEISNYSRLQIWQKSILSIANKPFLGVGIGNYPLVLGEKIEKAKQGASAHNLYLDFASEMGVLAPIILIFIFYEVLKTAYLVFKCKEETFIKIFAASLGLYCLWIVGYNLFDIVLLNDKVFLFFTANIGLLFSLKTYEK